MVKHMTLNYWILENKDCIYLCRVSMTLEYFMISLSIYLVGLAPYSFILGMLLNLSTLQIQIIGADSAPSTDLPSRSVQSWGCVSGWDICRRLSRVPCVLNTAVFAQTELKGLASKEPCVSLSWLIVPWGSTHWVTLSRVWFSYAGSEC